jgi:DNA-directed RNA polymerase specialized sigma24 family protein
MALRGRCSRISVPPTNLARRLTRNDADAEDVVQEACLRAVRYFSGYSGGETGKA